MSDQEKAFLHFRAMAIEDLYSLFLDCNCQIATDTRKISDQGALFFALSGEQFNGNTFAADAIKKGCAYAIIDDESALSDERFILVDNVLTTLQHLATFHRRRFEIPVIGITGSNGKTTTKELMKACLSTKYNVLATRGNFNNHIGVPLTLLALRQEHSIAIVEMGTNHPGEIRALAEIAEPTTALISSIGKAHLEGLGSVDGVAIEKLSLFDYVRENQGRLFANLESDYIVQYLAQHNPKSTGYTTDNSRSFKIKMETVFPTLKGQIHTDGADYPLDASLFGRHNLLNISAALTVSKYYGVDMKNAVDALNCLVLHNNRTETLIIQDCTYYLDAYNANPSSMIEAIRAFASSDLTNKWLILGDMFELGEGEIQEHQEIVEELQSKDWACVVLVGHLFKQTAVDEAILQFAEFEDMKEWFDEQNVKGKEILIKGSRGMRLERLIQ